MHLLVVSYTLKPETAGTFMTELTEFMNGHAVAHGNVSYRIGRAVDDESKCVLVEEWPTAEIFRAFTATPVFKDFVARLPEWLAGTPDGSLYRIAAEHHETTSA